MASGTVAINHAAYDLEDLSSWLALVEIDIYIVEFFGNRAGKKDDRNLGLDCLHFPGKFRSGSSVQHVIGNDRANRSFAKGFQGIAGCGHPDDVIPFLLQNCLAQRQVDRVIFDAQYHRLWRRLRLDCSKDRFEGGSWHETGPTDRDASTYTKRRCFNVD